MARPRKCRMVHTAPEVTRFKPQGVPASLLAEEVLPLEGLEALRLVDLEGLDQETAAARMAVSRPTFSRVLAAARRSVARALVQGLSILIEGGDYRVAGEAPPEFGPPVGRSRCGRGGRGGGHGRGGHGRGPGGPR